MKHNSKMTYLADVILGRDAGNGEHERKEKDKFHLFKIDLDARCEKSEDIFKANPSEGSFYKTDDFLVGRTAEL